MFIESSFHDFRSQKATKSNTTIQKTVTNYNLRHKYTHPIPATHHDTQKPTLTKPQSIEYSVADDKKKKQDEKIHGVQELKEAHEKEKLGKQPKLLQVRFIIHN